MSSSQQGSLALALVLLLLATAAGAAQASKQQQDGSYPDADAEDYYPPAHYREQPHDFGEYVRVPYPEQEQQLHVRMYDKSVLDLDPKASKAGYYPAPRNHAGDYRQYSTESEEAEMHRRHPEFENNHKGHRPYPTHSYPAPTLPPR